MKINTVVVVIMTLLIAGALSISFVFGQTDFLGNFSSSAQNESRCNSLADRAEAPGSEETEQYQELNCGEIYGQIDFSESSSGETGVNKMDGITIGQWPGEVFYDRNTTYNYEINFNELDGQNYLSVYGGNGWNSGVFEYNPDYNYTIGFQVAYPTEDGDIENNKQWGGDTGNICSGQSTCELQNHVKYSEKGIMENDLVPCQDTDPRQQNFTQRVFVQVYEDFREPTQQRKGWVTILNQTVTLSDNQGTSCWSGTALPTFNNGETYLRNKDIPTNMRIDSQENLSMTVDISNNPNDLEKVEMLLEYPTAPDSVSNLTVANATVGKDCQNACTLEAEVNLQEQAEPLDCAAGGSQSIDQSYLQFYLKESFEGSGSNSWLIDRAYAQTEQTVNSQYRPRCWLSVGPGVAVVS